MPNRFRQAIPENRFAEAVTAQGAEIGPLGGFVQGVNTELANLAGAPVDLVNFGGSLIDRGLSELDIELPGPRGEFPGGSEDVRAGFNALGLTGTTEFEELPRSAQIGFRGGQVVGASIPFAAAPLAAARAGVQGPRLLQPVLEAARQTPGTFAAVEGAGILGAAQGGALAEAVAPGNEAARLGAEIAGGFVNPAGLIGRGVTRATRGAGQITASFTRRGREARAAEIVQNRLIELGESPADVAEALRQADIVTTPLTAGQKSGSQALLDLEAKIAKSDRPFGKRAEDQSLGAIEDITDTIDTMTASGDPNTLRMAARIRQDAFDRLLSERLRQAEQRAAEASARIGPATTRAQASSEAFEALNSALKDARATEKRLWGRIAKDVSAPTPNLQAARNTIQDELLQGESIPLASQLDGILGGATSGDVLKLRNRALTKSREARAQGRFSDSHNLDLIADAALEDLSALPVQEIQEARDYSRLLNDKFTRSFGGAALARDRTGQRRIPPELMLERAFGRGGARGDLQFRELREAADFSQEIFGGAMRNQQEAFLRDVADQLMTDGVADPQKIRNFLGSNQQLLDQFPALKADLQDARIASQLLNDVTSGNQIARKVVRQKAAFARLIDSENPAVEVGNILRGANPSREYQQLARLARSAGPGTMAGLKTSTLDVAMNAARSADGSFSFKRLKEQLVGRGGFIPMMKRNKVMLPAEANRLERLVNRAIELEDLAGSSIGDLLEETDPLTDLVIRMAGVRIAAVSPLATQGPGQIVAAGAGSRFARRLFERIPQTRVADVIIEAAADPKFMAALLEKPKTLKRRRVLERQLNSFLIGIIAQEE